MNGLFWVMLGGALGSGARYGISLVLKTRSHEFPVGTLAVNLVGCLLIGFIATWLSADTARPVLRLALVVGILGGFTTFSSFGLETLGLLQDGRLMAASAYIFLSNGLGLALVWLGHRVAQMILPSTPLT